MQTFCTIITNDHLPFARTLHASIKHHGISCEFSILIIDQTSKNSIALEGEKIYTVEDLLTDDLANAIFKKYGHTNKDHFRWALKPVFINFLLGKKFSKVVYTDPDIFFVADATFLLNDLDSDGVLLTPHWRDIDPLVNEDNFITLFKDGQFNAGFVGASQSGIPAMRWWAEVCHYKMERNLSQGLFDDQRYLDALPVSFPNMKILRHQGCNLAFWNIHTCKREMRDGKVLINKQFEPVFIHFTKETVLNILNRNDKLLLPYLEQYQSVLRENGIDLSSWWNDVKPSAYQHTFYKVKHAARIRTRIKQFFFRLAEKL